MTYIENYDINDYDSNEWRKKSLSIFNDYVKRFGRKERDWSPKIKDSKIRNVDWVPFRVLHEDFMISIFVYRCVKRRFEVALFCCSDYFRLNDGASIRHGLLYLLSIAFEKTAKLEVHFTGEEGGFCEFIPRQISDYSASIGVKFKNPNVISHEEGKALFIKLAGLNKEFQLRYQTVEALSVARLITRGIWNLDEVMEIGRLGCLEPIADGSLELAYPTSLARSVEFEKLRLVNMALPLRIFLREATSDIWQTSRVWFDRSGRCLASCSRASGVRHKPTGFACRLAEGKAYPVILFPGDRQEIARNLDAGILSCDPPAGSIFVFYRDLEDLESRYLEQLDHYLDSSDASAIVLAVSSGEADIELSERILRSASNRRVIEGIIES